MLSQVKAVMETYKGPPKKKPLESSGATVDAPTPRIISPLTKRLANPSLISSEAWRAGKSPEARFPKRMTVGAHQRMAELDFDPLEWSVRIAKGEALTKNHPFLEIVADFVSDRLEDLSKGNAIDWEAMLEGILEKARISLTDSWVPLNLRSDHIKDLTGYLYPKLKAVEHSGTMQTHLKIKPLSASEIELFKQHFNEDY